MLALCLGFVACSPIDTFLTLILSNGREKTVVDSYADLVDHARKGTGNETTIGPNLLKEVEEAINFYDQDGNPQNNSIIKYISDRVAETKKSQLVGTLTGEDIQTKQEFIIDSLGSLVPTYNYTADYVCEKEGSTVNYNCTVSADIRLHGKHNWNANVRNNASGGANAFLQLFVYLRGNVRPFNVNYDFTIKKHQFTCNHQKL